MTTLILFLFICYAGAGVGGWLTRPGLPWLATLKPPFFNPPKWVFGPVWGILYGTMGVSGWLLYESPASEYRMFGLGLFGTQLVLNVAWSGLFFYLRKPGWALVDIVPLLITIWVYVGVVWLASPAAAALFIPYGLWVGFATLLNGAFWRLNGNRSDGALAGETAPAGRTDNIEI